MIAYIILLLAIYIAFRVYQWKKLDSRLNYPIGGDGLKAKLVSFGVPVKIAKFKPQLIRILLGANPVHIVITEPEMSRAILQNFKRGAFDGIRRLTGQSILNTDDHEWWKNDKKSLSHSFANRTLAVELYPHMKTVISQAHEVLKKHTSNLIEVDDFAQRITFDVIGLMVYGKNWNSLNGEIIGSKILDNVGHSLERLYSLLTDTKKMLNIFLVKDFVAGLTWSRSQMKSIVIERLNNPNEGKKDILQYVIEARRGRTDMKEVLQEVLVDTGVFITAGFETTAHTVAATIYFLSKNPEVQEKLFKEISNTKCYKDGQLIPEYNDLSELTYLQAVILESQRMLPVVPRLSRLIETDAIFENTCIPAGTIVHVSIVEMLHNPDLFPQPEKFQPERWINNNTLSNQSPGFIPFGGGMRACIGQNMARAELAVIIYFLISKYKWEVKPGFVPNFDIALTVKSRNGVWCHFSPRK